jgi:diguanylate cyclase (GGDEF)-like protein
MWCLLILVYFILGLTRVPGVVLSICFTGVFLMHVVLYGVFRSGFNKRLRDPSLTLVQMTFATFWIMLVVYYADSARGSILLVYLVVFVFGLFRLSVWQFLFLSVFAVINYAIVIAILFTLNPESINPRTDVLNILILSTVLPWFSLVGGYITHLRGKVYKALATIERQAIVDDLTQVFNRREMFKILEHQKALGDRGINPFSICIVDLDHFKSVNDTFGHRAGDIVLRTVAQEVHRNLRDIDYIARYGGEEFILILTNSGSREAMICAKRIRMMARELVFDNMPPDFRITISVGVTKYEPEETIQDAINRADSALYRAKAKGRDRVEFEPVEIHGELLKFR